MVMKSPMELLQEVKKLVFAEETAPAPAYTLADGTAVMIDKLEVGGVVTLADGTPAPAGEHTLADGSVLVVAEGGAIAEIKPKVEDVEEPEVDMAAKFAEIENRFSAYDQSFSALKSEYEGLKAAFGKQSEAMQGLIQLVDTLVNVPGQEPAEIPNSFKKHSAETKADRIKSYSQFVSQFKK